MTVDVTAIVLVVGFLITSYLGVNQLYRVANSKNYKFSLRSGILFFLTLGCIFRVLFWTKVATPTAWPNQVMALIFFIPVWMQFVGYTLLLVFYAAALSDIRSRGPMRYAIAVDSLFLVLCVTISLLMKDPGATENDKETIEIVYFTFNALLDFMVVVGLSYFGYRFGRKQSSHKTVATRILPRSPLLFLYVNWVVVAMSTLRGVFNIALITVIGRQDRLEMIYYHSDGDRHMTPYYLALYFLAVEIVPTICIFVTLWKRPSKRRLDKNAPLSTEAERAAANSIDEQAGVVVRHFGSANSPSQPAPPAWWSSFINNSMGSDTSSFRGSESPAVNEEASDDDYMMFRGVVHTGSATGDAVQIPTWTRNQILVNPSQNMTESGSLESGSSPYMAHSGGPTSMQALAPPKFPTSGLGGPAASSPLVGAAGTPPSFDTWIKQQRGEPTVSPFAVPSPSARGGSFPSPSQGSPILTTPYMNADSLPGADLPPPVPSNFSQTASDNGPLAYSGHSEFDLRSSARMSAVSTGHMQRPSDSSTDSFYPDASSSNQHPPEDGDQFQQDYLSPRDILLAQQKRSKHNK